MKLIEAGGTFREIGRVTGEDLRDEVMRYVERAHTREQLAELHLLDLKVGGREYQVVQKEDRLASLAWVSRMGLVESERPALEEALDEAVRLAHVVDQHAGAEEPLFGVATGTGRFRSGKEARTSELVQEDKLLHNAPETQDHFFKVASVLE